MRAVQDERRDHREVRADTGRRERLHAPQRGDLVGLPAQRDGLPALPLADGERSGDGEGPGRELVEERVTVRAQARLELLGDLGRQRPVRVVVAPGHVRRHGRGEHDRVQALHTGARDVAGDLAATMAAAGDPAGVVRLALLPDDGPTGGFFSWDGTTIPW